MNRSQLLHVITRLASALTEDFCVQDVLDRLAEELAAILPVVGAGVVKVDQDGRRHLIASARHVVVTSIDADARVHTVLSVPIRRGPERFGALEVYATAQLDADGGDRGSWQMLADVLASYLSMADRRESEATLVERLQRAAYHDPLTGLPNRQLLGDRLAQARERACRTRAVYGILFCDVDGFKPINDRFGHHAGDQLLVELARRLEQVVRPHDTVARISGDEFVVLCEDLEGPRPAEDVAERVLAAVARPFTVHRAGGDDKAHIRMRISIGIAIAGTDAPEPFHRILDRADAAMYRAKGRGGWCAEVAAPDLVDVREPARTGRI